MMSISREKESAVLKGPAKICAEAEEARALMDSILEREGAGRPKKAKTENNSRNARIVSGSQTVAYTLARLDRDAPTLAGEVRAGRMTANAAAIKAGFRKKPSPFDSLKKAWAKADQRAWTGSPT